MAYADEEQIADHPELAERRRQREHEAADLAQIATVRYQEPATRAWRLDGVMVGPHWSGYWKTSSSRTLKTRAIWKAISSDGE